ncbi:hypothetical protein DERP_012642 [Dermatophagoides pteronyssinus]|uniref:Secreted protein n=1 Tax=Dermatophagoides pteronyssinus TaxID=6956 RepID=A0ABQ8IYR8_DERPT|nr:hypothetical protein DERP_012642 [Dermatophagoides pteronyssinus]
MMNIAGFCTVAIISGTISVSQFSSDSSSSSLSSIEILNCSVVCSCCGLTPTTPVGNIHSDILFCKSVIVGRGFVCKNTQCGLRQPFGCVSNQHCFVERFIFGSI